MRIGASTSAALLVLAGCATGRVESDRTVKAAPEIAEGRITAELGRLGFRRTGGSAGVIDAISDRSNLDWSSCPPVLVSAGDDRRVIASPRSRSASVEIAIGGAVASTTVSVTTRFVARYLNPTRGETFVRDCRSTGVLERRLLDAAAG